MIKYHKIVMLLYSISCSVLCCDLNNTQPISAEIPSLLNDTSSRQVLVSNNVKSSLEHLPATLLMHSADKLTLIDRVDTWPALEGDVDSIYADPVAVDSDYNGVTDGLYVVNRAGLVWFIKLQPSGFSLPKLVADFRASGLSFEQPLQFVQFSAGGKGGFQNRQVMLLLVAKAKNSGDVLLALKHRELSSATYTLSDLTDRTSITNDEESNGIAEQLWQQIQQGAGWYMYLDASLVNTPQVYAGVVYFSAAATSSVNDDCSVAANGAQQLYAVHLHHAGLVYSKRNWLTEIIAKPELALLTDDNAQLQLIMQNEQQHVTVVDSMLAISERCADCVEELNVEQFPKIIRLATFQSEAY